MVNTPAIIMGLKLNNSFLNEIPYKLLKTTTIKAITKRTVRPAIITKSSSPKQ
jgi:hypothetical protein